jgi:putative nucleotidyltransferase with HDIG domain
LAPSDALALLDAAIGARLDERRVELPVMPDVATRILAGGLAESDDVRQLAALLHRDPALAVQVLRVANSASHGGTVAIQSIAQAVMRVGLMTVREVVVAVAVGSRVFRAPGMEDVVHHLWRHSVVAGFYAKEVARTLRSNVESAFLCGLLHDVGQPVLLTLALDVWKTDLGQAKTTVPERPACLEVLRRRHTAMAPVLAETWTLPTPVIESIAHHHAPTLPGLASDAACVAALADELAHYAVTPDAHRDARAEQVRAHPACVALNLYGEDLDALLAKWEAVVSQAAAFET